MSEVTKCGQSYALVREVYSLCIKYNKVRLSKVIYICYNRTKYMIYEQLALLHTGEGGHLHLHTYFEAKRRVALDMLHIKMWMVFDC